MLRALAIGCLTIAAIAACAVTFATDDPAKLTHAPPADITTGEPKSPPSPDTGLTNRDDDAIDPSQHRLREGTQLRDVTGRFRQRGDSLVFIDDKNREINGLPNLNMERILRTLKTVEEPEAIAWSVSGTITEFAGDNYLLISRAVYKSAAPPPAPENLAK